MEHGQARRRVIRVWCVRRSEEHTSELQSRQYLVCRLLLEKKKSLPTRRSSDLDRKSTRLNSSHANISYAVFCLKKKNVSPHEYMSHTRVSVHVSLLIMCT